MIIGAHVLFYSTDADADRAFLRDTFEFPSVDAGGGWLIFALPPTEAAVHPTTDARGFVEHGKSMLRSILYLMCDDVDAEIARLAKRHVHCAPVSQERWGRWTSFTLPSGQEMGLYQPQHPIAAGLVRKKSTTKRTKAKAKSAPRSKRKKR
jgi:predicted enzyme related to lactoylglutathione lyase